MPNSQSRAADPTESKNSLPEGWALVAIKDLCRLVNGRAFKPSEWFTTGLPIVRIQNLNNPEAKFNHFPGLIMDRFKIDTGELLFAWSGTPGTSFGAHIWKRGPAVLNQHIFRILFSEHLIDKGFFRLAINHRLNELIHAAHGGAGLAHVTKGVVEATELLIPPLAEQQRIVKAVEALLVKVSSSRDRLERVPLILSRLRQAVLAAACSGRLTEEWRREAEQGQPVQESLRQVQTYREAAARTLAQRESVRKIFELDEANDSDELPDGWQFVALAKLCSSCDYGTSAKSRQSGKVPVLRMGNIQNGRIDWTDLAYTSDEHEIRKYQLEPQTVLFNRTNSPELVGKTAIYRGERPAAFAGYLIRINVLPLLDAEYLNLCLNTPYARQFCSQVKTDGVSQSNINAQKLGLFEVPLCPLSEQREIVRRVTGLMRIAEAIEKGVAMATRHTGRLTDSILVKAFRGELVPTEAELAAKEGRVFERAEDLLVRIAGLIPSGNGTGTAGAGRRVGTRTIRARDGKQRHR